MQTFREYYEDGDQNQKEVKSKHMREMPHSWKKI